MRERLQDWFDANQPDEKLIYKDVLAEQVFFVQDQLAYLVGRDLHYKTRRNEVAWVISTHRSKSVPLPVFEVSRPDGSLRLYLRDNFYNWKLSVISEVKVLADFEGLFITDKAKDTCNYLHPLYFEGFPGELIFGHYKQSNKRQWSAEIHGQHVLWAAVFLICRAVLPEAE